MTGESNATGFPLREEREVIATKSTAVSVGEVVLGVALEEDGERQTAALESTARPAGSLAVKEVQASNKDAAGQQTGEVVVPQNSTLRIEDKLALELRDLLNREGEIDKKAVDAAFNRFVQSTWNNNFPRVLKLRGLNEHDARDTMQNAYIRALRSLKNFRGASQVGTWFYRVVENTAKNDIRGLQRVKDHEKELYSHDLTTEDRGRVSDEELFFASDEYDPVRRAEINALRAELRDALVKLDPTSCKVVVFRHIYDWTHEEIAKELGISVSVSKVRLHRAHKQLREILEPKAQASGEEPFAA